MSNIYINMILEYVVPIILIFTILYSILLLLPILNPLSEEKKNKIGTLIAMVLTLIIVIPHFTGSYKQFNIVDPIVVIYDLIINSVGILIGLFLLLILATTFRKKSKHNPLKYILLFGIFVYLIFYLINKLKIYFSLPFGFNLLFRTETILVLTCIFLCYLIIGEGTEEKRKINNEIKKTFYKDDEDD